MTTEDEDLLTSRNTSTSNSSSSETEEEADKKKTTINEGFTDSSEDEQEKRKIKRRRKTRTKNEEEDKKQKERKEREREQEEIKQLKEKLKQQDLRIKEQDEVIRKKKEDKKGILKRKDSPQREKAVTFTNEEASRRYGRGRSVAPEDSSMPNELREKEINHVEFQVNRLANRRSLINTIIDDLQAVSRRAKQSKVCEARRVQFKLKLIQKAEEQLKEAKMSMLDLQTRY